MSTTTFPEFHGELYSYADAIKRAPSAWRIDTISGELAGGGRWSREERKNIAPPGLGHFERWVKHWVYILPNGYALPVREHYGLDTPPPLPKPPSQWRKAACHCGPHTCGACGQPYWLEVHGMADGHCTYCYHAG